MSDITTILEPTDRFPNGIQVGDYLTLKSDVFTSHSVKEIRVATEREWDTEWGGISHPHQKGRGGGTFIPIHITPAYRGQHCYSTPISSVIAVNGSRSEKNGQLLMF